MSVKHDMSPAADIFHHSLICLIQLVYTSSCPLLRQQLSRANYFFYRIKLEANTHVFSIFRPEPTAVESPVLASMEDSPDGFVHWDLASLL